jgi:hypothetical protein
MADFELFTQPLHNHEEQPSQPQTSNKPLNIFAISEICIGIMITLIGLSLFSLNRCLGSISPDKNSAMVTISSVVIMLVGVAILGLSIYNLIQTL